MSIIEILRYEKKSNVFAWKCPIDELATWTYIIIDNLQEVILFKDGIACDTFGAGIHKLNTANIPVLSKLIGLPFGIKSPFQAEIWYINKKFSLDLEWETQTPIELFDPDYNDLISVIASGKFSIQIYDAKKFIIKLGYALPLSDKENITKFFINLYLTKFIKYISVFTGRGEIAIADLCIDDITVYIRKKWDDILEEYGVKTVSFNINEICAAEEDTEDIIEES